MNLIPIEDANTNFELVYLNNVVVNKELKAYPYCKIHGAMNKVNIFATGAYWRCISSVSKKSENNCRAGCIENK